MRIFPAETLKKSKGFTLLELLIIVFIIMVFLPVFFLNLDVLKRDEKREIFDMLSVEFSLLRERAISDYMIKYIEFDLTSNTISTGDMDVYRGFLPEKKIGIPEKFILKDVIINGEKFTTGKAVMKFYSTGMIDRVIMHFERGNDTFYTIVSEPLTAKLKEYDTYIEEIKRKEGDNLT